MNAQSTAEKAGFIEESRFVPQTLKIRCKCGGTFEVSLSDISLRDTILSQCCGEETPLKDLRDTINNYIHYVDSRASLIGKGWDVELPIDPECRPTA